MEVTILGRGKSLEKLEDFKTDFDKVILVNEFGSQVVIHVTITKNLLCLIL